MQAHSMLFWQQGGAAKVSAAPTLFSGCVYISFGSCLNLGSSMDQDKSMSRQHIFTGGQYRTQLPYC